MLLNSALISLFLSTPSARRATCWRSAAVPPLMISIHALREEGDTSSPSAVTPSSNFYPRPPRGGRLDTTPSYIMGWDISIHALREEGDSMVDSCSSKPADFYPRPPRGGRRSGLPPVYAFWNFYPRPPRGGRLQHSRPCRPSLRFLSTPSARRATKRFLKKSLAVPYFYPRPPRGGRPVYGWIIYILVSFLSTPSARRATSRP